MTKLYAIYPATAIDRENYKDEKSSKETILHTLPLLAICKQQTVGW